MPKPEDRTTLDNVSWECLNAHDGDWVAAAEAVRQRLSASPELYGLLIEPKVEQAVLKMVEQTVWNSIRRVGRKTHPFKAKPGPASKGTEGIEAMARHNCRRESNL